MAQALRNAEPCVGCQGPTNPAHRELRLDLYSSSCRPVCNPCIVEHKKAGVEPSVRHATTGAAISGEAPPLTAGLAWMKATVRGPRMRALLW